MTVGSFFEELTEITLSLVPHKLMVSFDTSGKINVKFRKQYSSWALWWDGIKISEIEKDGETFITDLKKRVSGEVGKKFFIRERY
jgi:hypothetical protein